jgi:pyridoxal phosphate enzyme (YggS family)
MNDINDNLKQVRERIATAALRCGRTPSEVTLLAVSKTFPAEIVAEALAAGQCKFGENRVQELSKKAPLLPAECQWHLIGHLQQNKVRQALQYASVIQSVDSLPLLQRINRIAAEMQLEPEILLEINISGEASKFGAHPDEAEALLEATRSGPARCTGLMTIAPLQASETELSAVFSGLRKLRDHLVSSTGLALPELSMGMSGDFEIAIAEGATIVRIGSAIFGQR